MSIEQFLQEALECSVYVSPRDVGLSADELREAATQAGYRPGETDDAIAILGQRSQKVGAKYKPLLVGLARGLNSNFGSPIEHDFRDPTAFEFVRGELAELRREAGKGKSLACDVIIERGVAKGLDRLAIELAITVDVLNGVLEETATGIRQAHDGLTAHLATTQLSNQGGRPPHPRPTILKTHGIVRDIIARRTDGRPKASNPLDAFLECLDGLGQNRFRAWWMQEHQELRLVDKTQQPTMALVLSASLAEAALTFTVPRAQKYGMLQGLDANPRRWKLPDLIKGVKAGIGKDPIFDERTALRALTLNETRQRIHAGFLIDSVPTGPIPDLKPEQVRDGLQTVDLVVRAIVDWLATHL
jgi:hypothetical protein